MKVAIYVRLSREDENKSIKELDSESIQNQKSMLINYSIERGWDIYKIYCDEDYSGIDSKRPEFNKLLVDGENHKFDIVLCKTQSRFTRDMEVVEKYLHNKFVEWNIRFISLVDHVDTLDKGNKKSRQINGLVNEWYLEDLSENIKKTFDSKRKQGLHIGSFVCYGYKRDKENKNKLVVDREVSRIIKEIFNLYENGYGVSKIATQLNNEKILTPTRYKMSKGLNFKNNGKNNAYWSESTITKILKNQMYIGNMVQGYNKKVSYKSKKKITMPTNKRIIVENTHEAIISKEQFNKVQVLFKERTRKCKNGEKHIFANKLICKDCKNKMYKCQNSKGYIFFSCKFSKKIYGNCTRHSIGYDKLKEIVENKIREKIIKYYDFNNIPDELFVINDNKLKCDNLQKEKANLLKEMIDINKAIKELYIDKVNGKVTENTFEELNKSFLSDKDNKQKEIEMIENDLSKLKEKEVKSKLIKENKERIISKYKEFNILNFEIVNEFIDFIEIGEKEKIKTDSSERKEKQDVIIHWNF